jgi:hypothetical protein
MTTATATRPDTLPRSPAEQAAARRLGQRRRAEMLTRARRIRITVATLATSLFIAAFAVVYVQLASGHDPALVADAKRAQTSTGASGGSSSTASKAAATESSSGSSESSASSSGESSSGESSSSESSSSEGSSPSAVTTRQS